MKIAIVGSGNIATFFGMKLKENKHEIIQVISNTEAHAKELADKLNANFSTDLNQLSSNADIILLAIKDDVLRSLPKNSTFEDKLIIHTAGSVSLDEIMHLSQYVGSIWCMYSINKNFIPTRNDIPLIINSNHEASLEKIKLLSHCISESIYILSDEQKTIAHLAAVFANNFANHLFTIGQDILLSEKIPFQILVPLIQNTIEKLSYATPDRLQTGPAIRHDDETIRKHLELLSSNESNTNIYKLITESIQMKYHL